MLFLLHCYAKASHAVPAQINQWGANLTALVHKNLLGPNPKHGIFLDSCLHQ